MRKQDRRWQKLTPELVRAVQAGEIPAIRELGYILFNEINDYIDSKCNWIRHKISISRINLIIYVWYQIMHYLPKYQEKEETFQVFIEKIASSTITDSALKQKLESNETAQPIMDLITSAKNSMQDKIDSLYSDGSFLRFALRSIKGELCSIPIAAHRQIVVNWLSGKELETIAREMNRPDYSVSMVVENTREEIIRGIISQAKRSAETSQKDRKEIEYSDSGDSGDSRYLNDFGRVMSNHTIVFQTVHQIPDFPATSISQDRGSVKKSYIKMEDVDCTVFAPAEAHPGDSLMVQVYVHIPSKAADAQSMAESFDSSALRRGVTSLGCRIERGSNLIFEIKSRQLKIKENIKGLIWRGTTNYITFSASIPINSRPQSTVSTIFVSQNNIPIGSICFLLQIVNPRIQTSSELAATGNSTKYNLAFISYASRDREEVLRRVQMLTAIGIRCFQDLLNLDPGDRWAQKLFHHIDESDVMFLFWSSAAKDSKWVKKEWMYALQKKGEEFIRPVIIEGPPIPKPPAKLKHLYFSDKILYFLKTDNSNNL